MNKQVRARQIFLTEEFQRIHVDTFLQEVELSPPFSDLFPKKRLRGKESNFTVTVEKPGKHYFDQVIKVSTHIINHKSCC